MGFQKEGMEYCNECGSETESGVCPSCESGAHLKEDGLLEEEKYVEE